MKRFSLILLTLVICLALPAAAFAGNDYAGLGESDILRRGSRGADVEKLQKALISLGYLSGRADGFFGEATEKAVSAFQTKNGFGGLTGYSGVATLFTQAVLFGNDNLEASNPSHIVNTSDGLYGIRSVSVRTLGETSSTFSFKNEGVKPIEAVCVIYWLADDNNRVVSIDGKNYVTNVVYDMNLAPGEAMAIATKIPASEKELNRASSLRFVIAEIAYVNGAVYVDYDASLSPYESDYFLAAEWR